MNNRTGFTLIELMVTLAVVGILMFFSGSFTGLLKSNNISTSVQDFVAAVNLTRNEAVSRATRVTMCKSDSSSNPRSCINDSTINNWNKGWIVFVDINNNQLITNPTQNLLRVYDSLANNIILNGDATSQDFVSFDSRGFRVNSTGGIQASDAKFRLCDHRLTGKTSREITVNRIGHVSTKKDSSANLCNT